MSPNSAGTTGPGWRLRVVHRTVHTYEAEVRSSYNEARLSPQSGAGQTVLDARVDVAPNAPITSYKDYWGTSVSMFDLHQPHQRLTVTGSSLVDTRGPAPRDEPGTWGAVETDEVADRWCEVLAPSRFVQWDEEITEVATGIKASAATPLAAVDAAAEWVRTVLTYRKGATHVGTTALEARAAGEGVCQDFAHLSLAVLRAAGVPARYVSGYFHPRKDAEVGEEVAGESHAWVEAWIGRWYPFDPTNGSEVRPRHVSVARGRDYKDVSPLKGVYSGGGAGKPTVTVELTRTA